MKIGVIELLLIFIVALVAIGPDQLPGYARKLGEALVQFRKATEDAANDIKESVVDPLEEVRKPLREATEPIEEMNRAVRSSVKDVQDSFSGIGKCRPMEHSAQPPTSDVESPVSEETEETESVTDINEEVL